MNYNRLNSTVHDLSLRMDEFARESEQTLWFSEGGDQEFYTSGGTVSIIYIITSPAETQAMTIDGNDIPLSGDCGVTDYGVLTAGRHKVSLTAGRAVFAIVCKGGVKL